jgi:hypothetical protein
LRLFCTGGGWTGWTYLRRFLILAFTPLTVSHGFIGDRPVIGEDEELITGEVEKCPVVADTMRVQQAKSWMYCSRFSMVGRSRSLVGRRARESLDWPATWKPVQPTLLAPESAGNACRCMEAGNPKSSRKLGGAYHLVGAQCHSFGDVLDIFEDDLVACQALPPWS